MTGKRKPKARECVDEALLPWAVMPALVASMIVPSHWLDCQHCEVPRAKQARKPKR